MTKKNLKIHSENILPIIKQWLYSDKDIFARELVSNACDAIHKLKILRDQGATDATDEEFRIDIIADKEAKTLKFIDTGIGMDADEVEKYIAQIAFSGAEDFVEKYKSNKEGDQIIGHFGLGFYSSYMVSSKVEIDTLSYKEGAKPAFWSCDGSSEYELSEGQRATRGTEITLYINEDNEEYLEEATLRKILSQYCAFLPCPVYLGESRINDKEPLWIKNPSECTDEDYLEFYRHLYPMEEEPLFWLHLNVDYPFHLKGILYFPKIRRDFDINKNSINLYCNRVFVSDNCKDVIPNYLTALRGVIDSPDIPLNVSRSYLQMDRTVRQLSKHISKKVSDSLANLHRNDNDRFIKCWQDVSLVVKLGILEDESFYEKVKNILVWKNLDGEWTTVEDYLERNREKTQDKVIYTTGEEDRSHFAEMYRSKGIEILCATSQLDSHLMQFLEGKIAPAKFQRMDGAIDEALIDKEKENTEVDADGKTEAGRLAEFFKKNLDNENIEVEAKSLSSNTLPGFIMIDENQRRMRDYMKMVNPNMEMGGADLFGKNTFVINTNNSLISSIMKLQSKDESLAKELINQVYDLSRLSQRELDPATLQDFVSKNTQILEKLSEKVAND
ncbi:MAG: molecular chaperone HtpG [Chlamydiota bacterium]|nr:molecular chaperone HtpG [Chlamydiota bacterium]